MGWYNDSIAENGKKALRHWEFGHANEPLIGMYDSQLKSTIRYHILLAWAAGIDGMAINVKDLYDHETMLAVMDVIHSMEVLNADFQFSFTISYDDQGFGAENTTDVALTKMQFLKDSILPVVKQFEHYKGKPIIFAFDYPGMFITDVQFRIAIDSMFKKDAPLLIWNVIDDSPEKKQPVDAFYPWVQPGKQWDKEKGLNWGADYLDYFYKKINDLGSTQPETFACGGVWPGFDDRSNWSWGGMRLMDRQDGEVYDSTWSYIHNYHGNIPLKYIVIETWNDWNEGTEIEPSLEDGYFYLLSTARNINMLKAGNSIPDTLAFNTARTIYLAERYLESTAHITPFEYDSLDVAITDFLEKNYNAAMVKATRIIKHQSNEPEGMSVNL